MPTAAGVGSAVGFLRAPVAYEVVRSHYTSLDEGFTPAALNDIFAELRAEAEAIVAPAAPGAELLETRTADMRYRGQGHEISFVLPPGPYDAESRAQLAELFETAYETAYARRIPDVPIEALNWTLRLAARQDPPAPCPVSPADTDPEPASWREMFDPDEAMMRRTPVFLRGDLAPGAAIPGPAVIAEDETTTVVMSGFVARINALGYIMITRTRT